MVMRSMLLRNSHVRAFDKFFDDAWGNGFRNPFAVMDSVLESITKPIPPEAGTKFTVYKMVPVEYEVTEDEDGSVHYNVVKSEPEKLESEKSE
jgi:hypothetical protein